MTKNIQNNLTKGSKEVPQLPSALRAYETSNQAPLREMREKRDFNTSNDTKAYQTSLPLTGKPSDIHRRRRPKK